MGKKRICIKVLTIVAAVFVIGVIITKTVDKRRQMYREQISEMLDANWNYQHDLSIEGTLDLFSFDFDLDGIDWRSMPVDRYLIYARIRCWKNTIRFVIRGGILKYLMNFIRTASWQLHRYLRKEYSLMISLI